MNALPVLLLVLVSLTAPAAEAQQAPRVEVRPESAEVEVGRTLALRAVRVEPDGSVAEGPTVRWFLVEGEAVEVDPTGRVTGVRPGRARVAAVAGQNAAFAAITVPELPAARIELSLPGSPLLEGTSAPVRVDAVNRLGDPVRDPVLSWASETPDIVRVDGSGRIFALSPGIGTVTASSAEGSASLDVEVRDGSQLAFTLAPRNPSVRTGDVIRFRAAAEGDGGFARTLRPGWSVSGAGASIEEEGTDGVFVAEEPGRYRVSARIGEDAIETTTVVVEPREYRSRLIELGRGPVATHHSGDMWAFEGVDGRDYVYLGTFEHDWMKAFDVTDPRRPVLTDSIRLDARRINDVKIHPSGAVGIITREGASNRRNGIVLLDLADPAHPTILSEYQETVTGGVHNVWIDGENELVYAVHDGTMDLHILDIENPRDVREVGRWGLDARTKTLHDVFVQDGYAYLSYWNDGLVILDVGAGSHGGSPRDPAFVSDISYPEGNTHVAWRHGDYVFVGDEIFPSGWNPDRPIEARGFIHVVDVSDLENPREVAWYEVPEAGAHNLWAEGDRLYIGYYQAGLRVLDISGELRGDLYAQGREVARLIPMDEQTTVPNWPMTWGAQLFKGNIFSSDLNSGLWVTRLDEEGATVF